MNTTVTPDVVATAPVIPGDTPPSVMTPVAAAAGVTAPTKASSALDDFVDSDVVDATTVVEEAPSSEAGIELLEEDESSSSDSNEGGDAEEILSDASTDLSVLDDLEDTTDESAAVVDVYKKKCLNCTHLVPWAEKTFKNCHFSSGNTNCPAQSMRIQLRIPYEEIIPRFMAAMEQNDTDRLIRLYEKLKAKPQWMQDAIHNRLKEEQAKRAAA